jgi:PleD family two-component response regulator
VRKAIADHAWTELVAGLRVTVSIGVAESRADQEAGEAGHERLLSRADAKLYLAKEEGRNRVVV